MERKARTYRHSCRTEVERQARCDETLDSEIGWEERANVSQSGRYSGTQDSLSSATVEKLRYAGRSGMQLQKGDEANSQYIGIPGRAGGRLLEQKQIIPGKLRRTYATRNARRDWSPKYVKVTTSCRVEKRGRVERSLRLTGTRAHDD